MSSGTYRPQLEPSETFFDAVRRNRRATWHISYLSVVAAVLMGVPLTLVLTPLVYSATLIVADVVNYFSPLPPAFWKDVQLLGHLTMRVGDVVINHKPIEPESFGVGLACVLLPGIVITMVLWMGMLALFRRGGVGGALAALKAREPNRSDLKELQLADVVAEMAIAAGLPAPRVMLVDSSGANAAAIGTSPFDARLVVSRSLLDTLNRDEMQGVLGHLIASIGNGDLKVAFMVTSVFETCGLLVTLINSPFGPRARGTLWRIVRYAFSRGVSDLEKAAEAEAVAALLTRDLDMDEDDITQFFDSGQKGKSVVRKIVKFVFFPIVFTNVAIQITLWFFLSVLVGPCMALLWRTRRYLADATAAELTRNPDELATALEKMSGTDTAIPAGAWASHLFMLNPKGDASLGERLPRPEEIRRALRAWETAANSTDNQAGGVGPGTGKSNPQPALTDEEYSRFRAELSDTQRAAMQGDAKAIAQLGAFGHAIADSGGGGIFDHTPDTRDIVAAQNGDQAALARLRALDERKSAEVKGKQSSGEVQVQSIISFHPSLKSRLKRLKRMGAHVDLKPRDRRLTKVAIVLWIIFGPLFLVVAGLMLVVIALMIMLNLLFLTLWLVVIHGVFGWLGHA